MTTELDYLHLKGTLYECCNKCDVCKAILDKHPSRITLIYQEKDLNAHASFCGKSCFKQRNNIKWWQEYGRGI